MSPSYVVSSKEQRSVLYYIATRNKANDIQGVIPQGECLVFTFTFTFTRLSNDLIVVVYYILLRTKGGELMFLVMLG
jgi:hypothetical protein